MLIREATKEDWDTVARLRVAFVAEVHHVAETSEELIGQTRDFVLAEHVAERARSWLVHDEGQAVGTVTLLLRHVPPHPVNPRIVEGYVINMYIAPSHRGTGVGRQLFETLLTAAREMELRRVVLHATEAGRPMYERSGFAAPDNWLELDL